MPFLWKKYLELSSYLIDTASFSDQCDYEANYRAAISRSYYAVHCTLRQYLIKEGKIDRKSKPTSKNTGVHEQVIQALSDYGIGTLQASIAATLSTMRKKRVQADYESNYFNPVPTSAAQHKAQLRPEASGCIKMADRIFEKLEEIDNASHADQS